MQFLSGTEFNIYLQNFIKTVSKNNFYAVDPAQYEGIFDLYYDSHLNVGDTDYQDAVPEIVLMMDILHKFPKYFRYAMMHLEKKVILETMKHFLSILMTYMKFLTDLFKNN